MKQFHLDFFFDRSMPEPNSGCWIWLNVLSRGGYGVVNIGNGRTSRAHRVSYMVANGLTALSSKIDVCHRCDNRACVNPDHLFLGTRTDNMRDCASKGRLRVPALSGDASPNSKLTSDQVRSIRRDPRSQRAIARAYGVDKGTIAHILHNKTWRGVI